MNCTANLKQSKNTQSNGVNVSLLDKLVQLRTGNVKYTSSQLVSAKKKTPKKSDLNNYHNRAKSKAITDAITMQLVDVKGSTMTKYYWNAYHCNNILQQSGQTLTASYCNTRHCINCNRIRTAKAILGYSKPLENLGSKYFVTITRQSVSAQDLEQAINEMTSNFRNVLKNLKNTYGIKLKGIRKLECNYNEKEDTYNPHFHLLVGGTICEMLLLRSLWLKQYTTIQADPKAQDVRKADEGSKLELFKYMAKMVTIDGINPVALDVIFTAMKGKRTIQPFGGIKKVSEDVGGIQKQDVDFITAAAKPMNWTYAKEVFDWVNDWGEVLTNYTPDKKTLQIIESINNSKHKPPKTKQSKKSKWLN